MKTFISSVLLCMLSPGAHAAHMQEGLHNRVNPIRKVVNMLTYMKEKVDNQAKKAAELHDEFMCKCKTDKGELEKSIAAYEAEVPEKMSDIEKKGARLAQSQEDLAKHRAERDAAKASMEEATGFRENEAADFAKFAAEQSSTIEKINAAVAALEKGMSEAFLQSSSAQVLKNLVGTKQDLDESDRSEVLEFLQGGVGDEYSPSSGEVTGILKQMGDEMSKGLSEAKAHEEEAVAAYEKLMSAKKKETLVKTQQIQKELERIGSLDVEKVTAQHAVDDTEKQLAKDKEFLAKLAKGCGTAEKDYEAAVLARSEETAALTETIKILNDDDALELFKKTLPSASGSFLQMQVTTASMRSRALGILRSARLKANANLPHLDFIALALHGKKTGFAKVIGMIDSMMASLKEEQVGDDKKVEMCKTEMDSMADKKTSLENTLADIDTLQADKQESIAMISDEIKALSESIAALDKSVARATEMRKEEHAAFITLITQDTAAKDLLHMAKNRMNKFYNPKIYKPPPKVETEDANTYFLEFAREEDLKEDSSGVLHMMDLLMKDLDKELTTAKAEEKDAQEDYEVLLADAKEKRAGDSKALSSKEAAEADLKAELQSLLSEEDSKKKELSGVAQVIASLHADCDWVMKYYDVRKTARVDESDSLSKAKAVLSGADYSLLQQASRKHKFLKRH